MREYFIASKRNNDEWYMLELTKSFQLVDKKGFLMYAIFKNDDMVLKYNDLNRLTDVKVGKYVELKSKFVLEFDNTGWYK